MKVTRLSPLAMGHAAYISSMRFNVSLDEVNLSGGAPRLRACVVWPGLATLVHTAVNSQAGLRLTVSLSLHLESPVFKMAEPEHAEVTQADPLTEESVRRLIGEEVSTAIRKALTPDPPASEPSSAGLSASGESICTLSAMALLTPPFCTYVYLRHGHHYVARKFCRRTNHKFLPTDGNILLSNRLHGLLYVGIPRSIPPTCMVRQTLKCSITEKPSIILKGQVVCLVTRTNCAFTFSCIHVGTRHYYLDLSLSYLWSF